MYKSLLKKNFCSVYGLSFLWLTSSVIIFLLGFFKLAIGLPISLLVFFAVEKAILDVPEQIISFRTLRLKWLVTITIILLWVLLAGIGGYMPQRGDHIWRNPIFTNLVQYSWPVTRGDNILVYYFGFWLLPAIGGKLFGMEAGFFFQVIWATIGITLTFVAICDHLGKFHWWFLPIFIFWGGLPLAKILHFIYVVVNSGALEHSTIHAILNAPLRLCLSVGYQCPQNNRILWNVFNQGIACWLGVILTLRLLREKQFSSLFLIVGLLLPSAPFPAVILVPFSMTVLLFSVFTEKNLSIKSKLSQLLSDLVNIENIAASTIFLAVAIFYKSNISAGHIKFFYLDRLVFFLQILSIGISGFLIYFIFAPKRFISNKLLLILTLWTLLLYNTQVGRSGDFSWRVTYPLSFFTMIFVMETLADINTKRWVKFGLSFVLCIAACYPIWAMSWAIRTKIHSQGPTRVFAVDIILDKENNHWFNNFAGTTDSFYFRHLAPRRLEANNDRDTRETDKEKVGDR